VAAVTPGRAGKIAGYPTLPPHGSLKGRSVFP